MSEKETAILKDIGLKSDKILETLKNREFTARIVELVNYCENKESWLNLSDKKPIGNLIYIVAAKMKSQIYHRHAFLLEYILNKSIKTEVQLAAAFNYLLDNPSENVDLEAFEQCCGVNVVVSSEQIELEVEKAVLKHKSGLLERRYNYPTGDILRDVFKCLKWADPKNVKAELDVQLFCLLGQRTAEDMNKSRSVKSKQPVTNCQLSADPTMENKKTRADVPLLNQSFSMNDCIKCLIGSGDAVNFHKVGENYRCDGYVITDRTMDLLAEHLRFTGGQVRTRFPPEPNGILHIGHAKAINFNFGYAKENNGICFLRYDDTNPEKEEEKFFLGILDMVQWLGYEPYQVTYSSDYFPQLYTWAVELIKRGKAYVCHQTASEIKGFDAPPSLWRDRPIEESLRLFEDMKNGKIAEGDATLRMKFTLKDGKKDPVAYRIKFVPHHHTGTKWCIYPTYDYTHCLCDSIEHITHSLCTKEFQDRRASYYWLCNALDVYCPVQWEYARLNLMYTVVSKRKILRLIENGIVEEWDDPRLYTLTALRRRGVPPEAINLFCCRVGVTMSQTALHPRTLDACVRQVLNATSRRMMVVVEPIEVLIENVEELLLDVSSDEATVARFDFLTTARLEVLDIPGCTDSARATKHYITFKPLIYIETGDFFNGSIGDAEKDFKRWTHDQPVGLKHCGLVLTFKRREMLQGGKYRIYAAAALACRSKNPKAFIHWVSDPHEIELNLYDQLFTVEDPEKNPDGFLAAVNTNSHKRISNAFADKYLLETWKPKVLDRFQFERSGYFAVDVSSRSDRLVFNRITTLK